VYERNGRLNAATVLLLSVCAVGLVISSPAGCSGPIRGPISRAVRVPSFSYPLTQATSAHQGEAAGEVVEDVAVTRHIVLPTSSAIKIPPVRSIATPTGRPRVLPSFEMKPVTTS
jgi:hypothetical protein